MTFWRIFRATVSPMTVAANTHISNEIAELRRFLAAPYLLSPDDDRVKEAITLLNEASTLLEKRQITWRMFHIEGIKEKLARVREILCSVVSPDNLFILVDKANASLQVVGGQEIRTKVSSVLDTISEGLRELSSKGFDTDQATTQRCRQQLLSVWSTINTAEAWALHRSNMIRARHIMMLYVLSGFLIVSIFLLPYALEGLRWYHIFAIQIIGALGGALSSIQFRGTSSGPFHEYYTEQTAAYLRPVVGASAALGISLMQLSGLLQFLPELTEAITAAESAEGMEAEGAVAPLRVSNQMPILMFVSFVAGFSERFFIGKVESVGGAAPEVLPSE
jgi:hypothetical protein